MKRYFALLALATACASPQPPAAPPGPPGQPDAGPFSVILLIGDGAGVAAWSAAKFSASDLGIEHLPVVGLVATAASNSRVTDSGAAATAYASGVRTFNGAIGVDADSASVRTVLEVAERRRMGTGLVATSTLTHATPAAFAAHVPSRNMHFEIAADIARHDIEVLLGGGKRYFDPAQRPDQRDLLAPLTRGKVYVESAEDLRALGMDTVSALVGLFAQSDPPAAGSRQPSLSEMTEAALRVLERQTNGFFLMVEGSQIDWRAHENAPLPLVIAEVLDLDMAVRQALQFQERRPNTLIVVVADHATGGLALHGDDMGVFRGHYTTEGHTAEMVPLFAGGPGAGQFGGVLDNHVVGQRLIQLVTDGGPRAPRGRASDDASH